MSYDIYFLKNGVVCQLPFTTPTGGTYCLDPNHKEAWFNMTYNYYEIMANHGIGVYRHKDDPKDLFILEEHTAGEIAVKLAEVIPTLKDDVDENYWHATEGNVKKALTKLLLIAVNVPQDATCEERS